MNPSTIVIAALLDGDAARFLFNCKSNPEAVCVTAVIVYSVAFPAIVKVSCIAGAVVKPSVDKVLPDCEPPFTRGVPF